MRRAVDSRSSTDPHIQATLSARSWDLCQEALETGVMILRDAEGQETKRIELRSQDLLKHVQWLASLSATKRPRTALPFLRDELVLGKTSR